MTWPLTTITLQDSHSFLQESIDDMAINDDNLPPLPASMQDMLRDSLSLDQNQAVALAAQLHKHIAESAAKGGGASDSEAGKNMETNYLL